MGEQARKPGCPELPSTPLELLTNRPGEGFTAFQMYLWPVTWGLSGVLFWTAKNCFYRRPWWAGIQYTVLLGGGLAYLSTIFRDSRYAAKAESDAVLRHYISLHPEDFPPYERKRIRDLYYPFEPIR